MYLVVIAWIYVAAMMGIAEATNTTGTVLGGLITFVLYGLAPVSLVIYLMGTPLRRRAQRAREQAQATPTPPHESSGQPNAGGHAPADALAAVRKEP